MNATSSVRISANTLTAGEIADCYRNVREFHELVQMVLPPVTSSSKTNHASCQAFETGTEHVWQVVPDEASITAMTDRGALAVFRPDDVLAPSDFPNVRCQTRDFVRLLTSPGPGR